jgi:hypothetical protein
MPRRQVRRLKFRAENTGVSAQWRDWPRQIATRLATVCSFQRQRSGAEHDMRVVRSGRPVWLPNVERAGGAHSRRASTARGRALFTLVALELGGCQSEVVAESWRDVGAGEGTRTRGPIRRPRLSVFSTQRAPAPASRRAASSAPSNAANGPPSTLDVVASAITKPSRPFRTTTSRDLRALGGGDTSTILRLLRPARQ